MAKSKKTFHCRIDTPDGCLLTEDIVSAKLPALDGYIGQSNACQGHNTVDVLNNISAPTLVMLGERDLIVFPGRSKVLADLIPNSELQIFQGVGHGFWREMQSQVDDLVLKFMDNNRS